MVATVFMLSFTSMAPENLEEVPDPSCWEGADQIATIFGKVFHLSHLAEYNVFAAFYNACEENGGWDGLAEFN